jgi:stearoyl-CoA desaturase (delta-9 desaturase)
MNAGFFHKVHIAGLVLALTLLLGIPFVGVSVWLLLGTVVLYYAYTMVGAIIGNHKYWAHESFKTNSLGETIMLSCAALGFEGHPLYWGNGHLAHHSSDKVDTDKDPTYVARKHNSLLKAIKINHFDKYSKGSIDRKFTVKMLRNPRAKAFKYGELVSLGVISLGLLTLPLNVIIYLWALPVVLSLFAYAWGQIRLHNGNAAENDNPLDDSVNVRGFWYRFIFCGEELQNNHHSFPERSSFAIKSDEVDVSDPIIDLLRVA